MGWKIKTFKTKEAMRAWLEKNEGKIQHYEIFVNNRYGVGYRKLRVIG